MTGRKKTETLIHLDMDKIAKDVPSTKDEIRKKIEEADPAHSDKETVGSILKKARTAKSKTLEDVSKKICVKPVYLDALETGKFYAFPTMTYGIGFLRLYAGFLGLDAKELVDKFKVEANLVPPPTQSLAVDTTGRLPSKKLAFVTLGLGVAFLVALGVMYAVKTKDNTAPVVIPTPQPVVQTEVETLIPHEPMAYGLKEPARISLKATEEAWIEVTDSKGTVLLNKILYAGDSYNPPANEKYGLSTGNAGALQLNIDGKAVGPLGAIGAEKKGIVLDSDTLKKEVSPKAAESAPVKIEGAEKSPQPDTPKKEEQTTL